MTTHLEASNGHLEAAATAAIAYQDLYDGPIASRRPERLAALNAATRTGLKLAECHALLAQAAALTEIADALRDLRPLDVLEPLGLERSALASVKPLDALQAARLAPEDGAR